MFKASFGAQIEFDTACGEGRCVAGGNIEVGEGGEYRVDRTMAKDEVVYFTVDGMDVDGPASGEVTVSVAVACDPQCEGKNCGADGCGGTCGTCQYPADICGPEQVCLAPESVTGNTCAAPFVVGALPFVGEGDTREAWDDMLLDEYQCGGLVAKGMGSADQVWQLQAGEAGDYEVVVTPVGWDAIVYALSDCADPVATCHGADDGQLGEMLKLTLGANESVFIVVDGEDNIQNDVGQYQIAIRRLP